LNISKFSRIKKSPIENKKLSKKIKKRVFYKNTKNKLKKLFKKIYGVIGLIPAGNAQWSVTCLGHLA